MFLERVTTKGRTYLYLKKYSMDSTTNRVTIYSFGRIDLALEKMKAWENDFNTFPQELKELNCTRKDLNDWVNTLETGIHKRSGRRFQLVV